MANALIIEDEVDLSRLLSLHLGTLGIRNEYVHSVQEANCLIGENCYDLIFLNINLAEGNGVEALTHIMSNNHDQKVIVVSDCDTERKNVLEQGALFFLIKPFTRKNIEHVTRVILQDK